MRLESEISSHDLHELLGVAKGATSAQIRAAYRREARRSHPDLNPLDCEAGRKMTLLNCAVRVLLDPVLCAQYERARRAMFAEAPLRVARDATGWYERSQCMDGEWGSPENTERATPAQQAFSRSVRHALAHAASRVQEILRSLGNEQRLMLAALCIAVGSGLLVWSHPSNAFWTPASRTASVEP